MHQDTKMLLKSMDQRDRERAEVRAQARRNLRLSPYEAHQRALSLAEGGYGWEEVAATGVSRELARALVLGV
ncbi:hypothetical protein [Caudoviricetes sp.]|nr:hypothetical protein [Caudoviricetes sp.]